MNLHGIVAPLIAAISPPITAVLFVSTGYTKAADFSQVPTYATGVTVQADVQALDAKEIEHLDSLSIQGILRAAYLNGNVEGIDRAGVKGGDLLTFNGRTWLVVHVLETWDSAGWCKVAIQQQNPAAP